MYQTAMISPSSVRPRTADALLVMELLISLIAGTVLVWRSLQEAESLRGQQLLQQETNSLARQIETHFNYQSDALQRLAQRWDLYHRQPWLWEQDADRLLHDFANLQAIEWLGRDLQVQRIRPLLGNEQVIRYQYPEDHPNIPYLQRAAETGQPVLSSHFELIQGGYGLAYHIPMHRTINGSPGFDGYLVAIFRV